MKTSSTFFTRFLATAIFVLAAFTTSFAQPDYSFTKHVLESGKDLQDGAKYRFFEVKPGLDAIVHQTSSWGGISLNSIDENWTGFDESFQPFINVPPLADGYLEFEITFVAAGTNKKVIQDEVPVTPIDVDGVKFKSGGHTGNIYEQDMVELVNGYYNFDMASYNLQITNPKDISGDIWVSGENTAGFAYDGIDTTAKDVMFTIVNSKIASFKIKIGARNTSTTGSDVRYRSVYFQKFIYPNAFILPNRTTLSFSGSKKQDKVELKALLSASHTFEKVVIEKSNSGDKFSGIGEVIITSNDREQFDFSFLDNESVSGVAYYRLRLVNSASRVIEYSNVIMFNSKVTSLSTYKVYPSLFKSSVNANIRSTERQAASFLVVDYSGRIVFSKQIQLQEGENNFTVDGLDRLPAGNYISTIKTNDNIFSQKIVK
jgi:hypothetical protein